MTAVDLIAQTLRAVPVLSCLDDGSLECDQCHEVMGEDDANDHWTAHAARAVTKALGLVDSDKCESCRTGSGRMHVLADPACSYNAWEDERP